MSLHVTHELPQPTRKRWQPLRAGLVDIFLYDDQEFWFHDGRLLLRGNNGTGKSKVLALMLPFLLDGELSPPRVEPDGDPGKRMEWNLLLGGRYDDRLGYTWLEFGRLTDEGEAAFLTIGCGIKAVSGRGVTARWFFVAPARQRTGFRLISQTGAALTRERLIAALEPVGGQVYDRAQDYRRAVDERLFHLGPDRYDGLVNLLIQLRQPQLSKRPDQERLSKALSLALAPVDQAVLSDLAEAFHDLERQRDDLRGLQHALSEVQRFLEVYRRYAAVAARRQSQQVRSIHARCEELQRELAALRQDLQRAEVEEQHAAERRREAARELAETRGRAEELRERPEVRELETADRVAKQAMDEARRAAGRQAQAEGELTEQGAIRDAARALVLERRTVLLDLAEQISKTAEAAGFGQAHRLLMAELALAAEDSADEGTIRVAETRATELARQRWSAIGHVQRLLERAVEANTRVWLARQRLAELMAEADAARAQLADARASVADAAQALLEAWQTYASSLVEVQLGELGTPGARPGTAFGTWDASGAAPLAQSAGRSSASEAERLWASLSAWTESPEGDDPASVALSTAGRAAANALAEARAQALGRQTELQQALAALTAERERLERGEASLPPPPYTRDPDVRARRPGAPLCELVDFRDDVDAPARARLEAALQAAGILDAWVTADGQLLEAGQHDVLVVPGPGPERHLGRALRPAIDRADPKAAGVSEATVEAILASIGLEAGDDHSWVATSGEWRLGVTRGSWSKPAAAFIGRGARDAARRQRLTELAGEIERAQDLVAAAAAGREHIEAQQRALDAELARAPRPDHLREAHHAASQARRVLAALEARLARQEADVRQLAETSRAADDTRDRACADLGLPADPTALEHARQLVADYRAAAGGLWPEARAQIDRVRAHERAQRSVERAEHVVAERIGETDRATREARSASGRWSALRDSIGSTVEQIQLHLRAANQRIGELEAELDQLDQVRGDLRERIGQVRGRQSQLETSLADVLEGRSRLVEAFERLTNSGLLNVAVPGIEQPEPPLTPDPAVRLARRLEQLLADVDLTDSTWERIRRELTTRVKELQDSLGMHGHQTTIDVLDDNVLVVQITFQGQNRGPDGLARLLAEEVEHRERLLSARERDLLEEHLVNDVACHLQELISGTEAQVQEMNEELRQRPTSTGMRLRLRWVPRADGPPGLAEARTRLLRQTSDAWSLEDRQAVSLFLRQQLEAVRAANESGTWQEHLASAFDYRQWHQFIIERWQDNRWRPAGGPASSGERVLSVTLPLFAAASAHYRSAHASAPRLVMLDEAFAGVDDDSRSKCMGLLETFDLDFVMTSEREWGCYASIGGLAIHQLARHEGIEAVHVSRWEWDGKTRARADVSMRPLVPTSAPNGVSRNGHLPRVDLA